MITRQMQTWLEGQKTRPQIVHLMGLRQTGKTTLMEAFRGSVSPTYLYPLQDIVMYTRSDCFFVSNGIQNF